MRTRPFLITLAAVSLISAGAASAQGRGGGHGQGHGASVGGKAGVGLGVGRGAHGRVGAGVAIDDPRNRGIDVRTRARANARGPERASPRAIERANENSVIRSRAALGADLSGLSPGLVVRNSAGARIGTVSRVIRTRDGTIRNVLVRAQDGRRTLTLAPASLSLSGDMVTTTSTRFD